MVNIHEVVASEMSTSCQEYLRQSIPPLPLCWMVQSKKRVSNKLCNVTRVHSPGPAKTQVRVTVPTGNSLSRPERPHLQQSSKSVLGTRSDLICTRNVH
eukprot:335527-Rhodomonas_salina.1